MLAQGRGRWAVSKKRIMIQACLIESERKELKKCWDYLLVSILGSCLSYRGGSLSGVSCVYIKFM